ncbi:MAG: hypothetical protein ACYC8V_09245 [Caulobacteraceae bacterium]
MDRVFAIAAVLVVVAGGAQAEQSTTRQSASEAVPTAGGAGPGGVPDAAATKAPGPLDQPDEIVAEDPGPLMGPCGPTGPDPKDPDKADHKAHGEVFAGVGTGGYREAGGVICQPLGDHAAVTVGIDTARWSDRRWRH